MARRLPERWLVVRLSAMGDAALCTGVLRYWYMERGLRFTVLTREGLTPLFDNHPAVEQTIGLKPEELQGRAWVRKSRALAREFAGLGLLDLHGVLRSRVLRLAWRSRRAGPVRGYPKFSLARRLYLRFGISSAKHTLESLNVPQRYALALEPDPPARRELLPRIYLSQAETTEAETLLSGVADRSKPLAALHPFATHPNKAWPRESWRSLAKLLENAGWEWIVLGTGDPLFQDKRDLSGQTNLRQSCALLSLARGLAGNDSGPMHLAAGVGTPVTALFGPTDRAWGFYPEGPFDSVLETDLDCRPCSLHGKRPCPRGQECLATIAPEQVFESLRRNHEAKQSQDAGAEP